MSYNGWVWLDGVKVLGLLLKLTYEYAVVKLLGSYVFKLFKSTILWVCGNTLGAGMSAKLVYDNLVVNKFIFKLLTISVIWLTVWLCEELAFPSNAVYRLVTSDIAWEWLVDAFPLI